jgi:hypothetical protein
MSLTTNTNSQWQWYAVSLHTCNSHKKEIEEGDVAEGFPSPT